MTVEGEDMYQKRKEETAIECFNFKGTDVRVVDKEGNPWFIAKDICGALGISKYRDTCAQLDDDERGSVLLDTLGGPQKSLIISESGVYYTILRSRKEGAKEFQRWIRKDVIPSIRKHGYYVAKEEDFSLFPKILPATQAAVELAKMFGYEGNQAVLTGAKVIKNEYGVDLLAKFKPILPSPIQERLLTATQIGHIIGESAVETNKILRAMKLLLRKSKSGKKSWKLSKKGKKYGVYLDVGKSHSDGTPIQQIKWYESVVPKIEEFMDEE